MFTNNNKFKITQQELFKYQYAAWKMEQFIEE